MNTKIYNISIAIIIAMNLYGQNDDLQFRFGNIDYDRTAAIMKADIEVWTSNHSLAVCAMNARFFYEDEYLEFMSFSDFQKGYDFVNDEPKPIIGGEKSARKMFNSLGKAGYMNAGIELKRASDVEGNKGGEWIRLVRVNFRIKQEALDLNYFCPSLIWERGKSLDKPGLLTGSVGAAASVLMDDSQGNIDCKAGITSFDNLNWELESNEAPFGSPVVGDNCTSKLIISQKKLDGLLYSVDQNTPNPYSDETTISIDTPTESDVHLNIYDIRGQLLIQNTEHVTRGNHNIKVDAKNLAAGTYMYQVIINNYKSEYFKMIKLGR